MGTRVLRSLFNLQTRDPRHTCPPLGGSSLPGQPRCHLLQKAFQDFPRLSCQHLITHTFPAAGMSSRVMTLGPGPFPSPPAAPPGPAPERGPRMAGEGARPWSWLSVSVNPHTPCDVPPPLGLASPPCLQRRRITAAHPREARIINYANVFKGPGTLPDAEEGLTNDCPVPPPRLG